MPGTRADYGGDDEIRTHNLLFTKQPLFQLELHRRVETGRGVRPTRLFELHGPGSHRSTGMSHAPITCETKVGAQGRTQTFNLWFVGPALHQLSYSGKSLVVGVGIEPTFRAFQARANPSQLSDLWGSRQDSNPQHRRSKRRTLPVELQERKLERAVRLELTHTGFAIRRLSRLATRASGTEGEIRTLESSLEDSHVSSYITSA